MIELGEKKSIGIFIGLMLFLIIISLAAYSTTGDMDIEERFTHAIGIQNGGEIEEGGEGSGFALEGSSILYAVVLGVLLVACYGIYQHFSR